MIPPTVGLQEVKKELKIRFASVGFVVDVHDAERLLDSVLGLIRQVIRKCVSLVCFIVTSRIKQDFWIVFGHT